jgi:hypothetical protein
MAKLSWYFKSKGCEAKDGKLYANFEIRRIYIYWLYLKYSFLFLIGKLNA